MSRDIPRDNAEEREQLGRVLYDNLSNRNNCPINMSEVWQDAASAVAAEVRAIDAAERRRHDIPKCGPCGADGGEGQPVEICGWHYTQVLKSLQEAEDEMEILRAEAAPAREMRAAIREVWEFIEEGGSRSQHVLDLLRPFVEDAKGPEHTRNILLGAVKEYYEGASSEVSEALTTGGERIPGPADNAADGDQCPCSVLKSGVKRRCTLVNAHFGLHLWEGDEHIPCGRYGTCGPWSVRCSLPLGHDGDHACREQMTDGSPIWDANPGVPEITLPDLLLHEVDQAEAAPCGAECNFRHCKTMCKRVGDHDVCYCPAHGKIVERDRDRTVIRESVGSLLVPMATQLADLTARLTAVEQCHNEGETDTCEQLNEMGRRLWSLEILCEPKCKCGNVYGFGPRSGYMMVDGSIGCKECWTREVASLRDQPASARPSEEKTDE